MVSRNARPLTLIAVLLAACAPRPPAPASSSSVSTPSPSASAMVPAPAGVRVVASGGRVLATYSTLTRTYSGDEGLPYAARCTKGRVPWLAGGRADGGGFVLCLPDDPERGADVASLVVSLSRTDLFRPDGPRRFGEIIHAWWFGEDTATVSVREGEVDVHATVTVAQLTTPASFTGSVPDEIVELEGTALLVH